MADSDTSPIPVDDDDMPEFVDPFTPKTTTSHQPRQPPPGGVAPIQLHNTSSSSGANQARQRFVYHHPGAPSASQIHNDSFNPSLARARRDRQKALKVLIDRGRSPPKEKP